MSVQPQQTIQEPLQYNLVSEVSPSEPVGYWHRIVISNTGDTNAINCGFYIAPAGGGTDPSSFRDLETILSWTLDSGSLTDYGVFTIQGSSSSSAFLTIGTGFKNYNDTDRQHNYLNGVGPDNRIKLVEADGDDGDELHPIDSSDTGSVEVYLLVKIPDNTPAAQLDFDYIFYYEESI